MKKKEGFLRTSCSEPHMLCPIDSSDWSHETLFHTNSPVPAQAGPRVIFLSSE